MNTDRTGGYLCVSLLQDFVLDSMLKNFTKAGSPTYCINIIMIHQPTINSGSHFQRYLIHVKPSDKLTFMIQESLEQEPIVKQSAEEVKDFIKSD